MFKSTTEKLDPPQTRETPQLRRVGCGIDAAFESREHLADIHLSANGSTCIRMTPEISRERERFSLLLARPARARLPRLRQRLVDLNLALHVAPSRFWFFKTADLPPEQDFLQGQETDRAFVRAKRLMV
ncbi:MAG TPA: hypothetical protein VN831_18535 [Bradyrhizobium sp.]|nr:hypothetical protein [Bradyrhizobium sp.]